MYMPTALWNARLPFFGAGYIKINIGLKGIIALKKATYPVEIYIKINPYAKFHSFNRLPYKITATSISLTLGFMLLNSIQCHLVIMSVTKFIRHVTFDLEEINLCFLAFPGIQEERHVAQEQDRSWN